MNIRIPLRWRVGTRTPIEFKKGRTIYYTTIKVNKNLTRDDDASVHLRYAILVTAMN